MDEAVVGRAHEAEPHEVAVTSWHFRALLSAASAAPTGIFANLRVENVSAAVATFIRIVVILAALGATLLATGQWQPPATIAPRRRVLVLSGLATGGSWICCFGALKLGGAARLAPIDKPSVALVALFGVAFLGERLSVPDWLGVVLIAAGAVLVADKG
jgi:bacterial/archaeal transporter family protein